LTIDINANVTEWCQEEYVEIYEKSTNKLVSRVKEEDIDLGVKNLSRIDISFLVTEFTGYCDYCYNGIQDFDETGVDCGGPNCPECVKESFFFNWLFWLLLFLWTSIVIFTGTIIWEERMMIIAYFREEARRRGLGPLRGVERMAYYQRPGRLIQTSKKSKPTPGFKQMVRKGPRGPLYGNKKTERGINVSRPRIEGKYNVKDVAGQKERQTSKGFMSKIKDFFTPKKTVKPEKVSKLFKPSNSKASGNISSTRGKIKSDF
jgi:hypothetical protein